MTDYRATPEQWADAEENASKPYGSAWQCLLELRARVEALEAMRETEKAAVLDLYEQHDKLKEWVGKNYMRIRALEDKPEPISEEENDRRFQACIKLIDDATPKQMIPTGSLVDRVTEAIADPDGPVDLWHDDARAAIREVAAWLKENGGLAAQVWSEVIEQEAKQ